MDPNAQSPQQPTTQQPPAQEVPVAQPTVQPTTPPPAPQPAPQQQVPPQPAQDSAALGALKEKLSSPPSPSSSSGKRILFIVLGIIVALGLLGGGYYLGMQKSSTVMPQVLQKKVTVTPTVAPTSAAVATSAATTDWKTYTNTTIGYSLEYPSDWQTVATSPTGQVVVVVPNNLAPALKADIQKGEVETCHPYYPIVINDVTSQSQATRFANTKDQTVTQSPIKISGLNAILYSVNMNSKPCDFETGKFQSIIVIHSGKTYSIDLIPSDTTAYKQVFDQLVSSFKFTN